MTFKNEFYAICEDIARDSANWSFVKGRFRNSSLGHSNLFVGLGSSIQHGFATHIQPGVAIDNKRFSKLWHSLLGYHSFTSVMRFQALAHDLLYVPEHLRLGWSIWKDPKPLVAASVSSVAGKARIIRLEDAKPYLEAVLRDGIRTIEKYYDLSSETALLSHLPPRYEPVVGQYDEFEMNGGVRMCVIRILQGDFDFVKVYRSDEFKTLKPKRYAELDIIIAALPELKLRYEKKGSVI